MSTTLEEARAVVGLAREIFSALAQVVGAGITKIGKSYAVKINLRESPPPDVTLPEMVNGVPVRVQVVGRVLSLGHPDAPSAPDSK